MTPAYCGDVHCQHSDQQNHIFKLSSKRDLFTNDDLKQHLTLLLEGAATEVLRDFDDTSTAFADLWSRLEHRFGEVDGCVMPCTALRPDVSRTLSRWSSLSRRYGSSSSPYLFSENNTKNIIGHKQINTIGRLPEKHKTH